MHRNLAALAVLFAPLHLASAQDVKRPNILIILADDLGYADVGFHGCKDIPTPHIDSIAKNGVRCTNGYVSGPYCSPTRAGLMTGRYQERFGHEFNPGGGTAGLPVSETTIADRMKKGGYATGIVGKWHLGAAAQFHPQKRGFEEFFGFLAGAHSYFPGKEKSRTILRGTVPADEQEYLTDAIAREALAFIDHHKKEPFLLYMAFNAVHTPMHATDKYLKRFEKITDPERRTYAAMLSAADDAVGAVLAKLRESGLEENTLIFFFSDNGGPTMKGTTINGSRNDPLRGSKRQTLEGGIRVPFAMQWKGKLPAGMIYEKPVIQLDIQPTALAAAGIEAKGAKFDGVNLLPFLQGNETGTPHDVLYWRFGEQMAIRKGDWKLVRYGQNTTIAPNETWPKLYNLAEDIGEANDLAAKQPEKVKELQSIWDKWNAELVNPLWGGGKKKK